MHHVIPVSDLALKVNVFMIRLTSFPILLFIALYERQAKRSGAFTFYETVSAAAEKIFDTLPRHLKRLSAYVACRRAPRTYISRCSQHSLKDSLDPTLTLTR